MRCFSCAQSSTSRPKSWGVCDKMCDARTQLCDAGARGYSKPDGKRHRHGLIRQEDNIRPESRTSIDHRPSRTGKQRTCTHTLLVTASLLTFSVVWSHAAKFSRNSFCWASHRLSSDATSSDSLAIRSRMLASNLLLDSAGGHKRALSKIGATTRAKTCAGEEHCLATFSTSLHSAQRRGLSPCFSDRSAWMGRARAQFITRRRVGTVESEGTLYGKKAHRKTGLWQR